MNKEVIAAKIAFLNKWVNSLEDEMEKYRQLEIINLPSNSDIKDFPSYRKNYYIKLCLLKEYLHILYAKQEELYKS